ncbi:hypothetical protein [Branchiibius sp. NY16-3462-2]|uniref:hypothetical protein n=1 Tax=Branchiibius sp. NY16-3462-2 TaxID=1807500 RepID=UPI0007986660|nr:hypothetical protein [Branchiibius sp. NY16-3462-2]KYH45697.1 hypothetical protein AZH51_18500 [Branchiibius sp. NY16-3462-2]
MMHGVMGAKVKLAIAATMAAGAMALSGCSSNSLIQNGYVAARFDGNTVTNQQVQDALLDVRKVNAQFDSQSAAVFLALNPQLSQLAGKYGVATSTAQAKAAFPATVKNPSTSAISVVQSSMDFQALRSSEQGQPALAKLISTADVELNPRYGTWQKGVGPTSVAPNWISASPAAAAS